MTPEQVHQAQQLMFDLANAKIKLKRLSETTQVNITIKVGGTYYVMADYDAIKELGNPSARAEDKDAGHAADTARVALISVTEARRVQIIETLLALGVTLSEKDKSCP